MTNPFSRRGFFARLFGAAAVTAMAPSTESAGSTTAPKEPIVQSPERMEIIRPGAPMDVGDRPIRFECIVDVAGGAHGLLWVQGSHSIDFAEKVALTAYCLPDDCNNDERIVMSAGNTRDGTSYRYVRIAVEGAVEILTAAIYVPRMGMIGSVA